MKKFYLLAILAMVFSFSSKADYCINDGTLGNGAARSLTSFTLEDGTNSATIAINQSTTDPVYYDMTAETVTLISGAEITPTVDYSGVWMCSYLWVDFNNDGVFTPSLNADGTPASDSELIAFSYYNGVDHTGAATSPAYGVGMANFTMPSYLPGTYYARFNIDYNTIDPCGTAMDSYYGGSMTDFTLQLTSDFTGRTVTVSSSSSAMGTVSGGGTGTDAIVCSATANSGYGFINWTDAATGDIVSTDATFSYIKTTDIDLVANFAAYFTVTLSAGDNGSISPEGTASATGSLDFEVTVTPDTDYRIESILVNGEDVISQLSGSAAEGGTVTIEAVDQNYTVVATFTDLCSTEAYPTPYSEAFDSSLLTCWNIINNNGDATTWYYSSDGYMYYYYTSDNGADDWLVSPLIAIGDNVSLTFSYGVGSSSFPEKYSVWVMTAQNDVSTAIQVLDTQTATNSSYYQTQTVNLKDYAGQELYVAVRCESDADKYMLYLKSFKISTLTYAIPVSVVGQGTVSINGGEAGTSQTVSVEQGSTVTLSAVAETGFAFSNWTDADGTVLSTDAIFVYEPEDTRTVYATFLLDVTRAIALSVNDATLGTVSFVSPESEVTTISTKQETVIFTTEAIGDDSFFVNWTSSGSVYSEDQTATYTGTTSIALTANYEARYTVTTTAGAGGTIAATYDGSALISGVSRVTAGETVNIMLTISDDRELASLVVDGVDVTSQYNYTSGYNVVVNAAVVAEATFKYPDAKITYASTGAGYVEVSANDAVATNLVSTGSYVTYGAAYYIYTTSYNGGELQSLTVNGASSDYMDQISIYGSAEFYASGDQYIEATFSGTSTGIEDATAASATVYGVDGAIVITANGSATIYTLTGSAIETVAVSGTTTVAMEQGVYIVSIDGASYKAIVK